KTHAVYSLSLHDALPIFSAEHQEIVRVAVHRLRAFHERTPDPFGLLEKEFSLRQLRELHEIVAGESLQADTFRRTMLPLLDPTGDRKSTRLNSSHVSSSY